MLALQAVLHEMSGKQAGALTLPTLFSIFSISTTNVGSIDHNVYIEPLTRRESEVLELLAQYFTASEIAERLVISENTVKRHRANIYQKLGVNSRREALAVARHIR